MTQEQIKAKAKEYFPNDELKQQAVIDVINWATKELQKKNAELKGIKDVATLIRANNDTVVTLMQLNNMLVSKSQQLTKAKKLLKRVVLDFHKIDCVTVHIDKTIAEAEQFLSEVENV